MITGSLLIVDDDATIRETLTEYFDSKGMVVLAATSAAEARDVVTQHLPDVIVLDLRLPDADGLGLLDALRADDPDSAIVVLTGHADVRTAVAALQRGALDLLEKPLHLERLREAVVRALDNVRVRREVAVLRSRDAAGARTPDPALQPSFGRMIELAARNDDAPVLILGETGTGKGFVARRIHEQSRRANHAFVEMNCASFSPTFFESDLFGHERGAFTDARQSKRGLLEVAAMGTVFLDEIGELSRDVQPMLLKVIDEQRFRRMGGTTELRSDARVICATNQPLQTRVAEKLFRADLFYRLQVLTIVMPPLRERRDELPALIAALLPRGASLGPDAMRALLAYHWPGNIRELKNTLWRAAIMADGAAISVADLNITESPTGPTPARDLSLAAAEKQAIAAALAAAGGNRARAALLLGIARLTLHQKLRSGQNEAS
jgi:DNA-binding NtrC family response regulator